MLGRRYAIGGTLVGAALAGVLAVALSTVLPWTIGAAPAGNASGTKATAGVSVRGPVSAAVVPRSPARLAWFYKPPLHDADDDEVLSDFSTYILTRGDESFVSRVRAHKPRALVLQYFLLNQIIKPSSGATEQRNNAAYMPGDFAWISSQHSDWFLHDQNGQPIVEGGKYYRMDPGNEDWRTFWITRVRAANGRWDGVFLDNLDLSLAGFERHGIRSPSYPSDDVYTDALAGFLERIHREVAQPTGKPVYANLVNPSRGRDATPKYLDSLDGAMDEGWALGWGSGHISGAAWLSHLERVDQFAARKDRVILVAQGDRWDLNRQAFAYGSYLLVAGPRVSFRYTRSGSYGQPWIYDNYRMPLGSPIGPRYLLGNGQVRRDFVNGCVTVDPDNRRASIDLGPCPPRSSG